MKCEGELINMTRAWDKENSESPTGIEPIVIVKILEVAFTQILNNYRGSAVRDIRTPLGRFKLI